MSYYKPIESQCDAVRCPIEALCSPLEAMPIGGECLSVREYDILLKHIDVQSGGAFYGSVIQPCV